MKKNIYLVQVSAVYGESVRTAYLPYASGCLAAYAWSDEKIADNYNLGRFIFIRENIDRAVDSLENPFLVGFSSYIWNMEYNREFARRLKEKHPHCIVVFGGHNVDPHGKDLDDIPWCDIVIHGEGEKPFKDLLISLVENGNLSDVNNISYKDNGKIVTTEKTPPCNIEDFPSPYLSGCFDSIIEESGISPSVIWETNRGCPNRCAFCDWGALKAKVRHFPTERIKAELDWMVKNKVEYVYCADANFGLFPRDSEIADLIIKYRDTYGYPQVFKTNYTKNRDEVVFEISSKLINKEIGKSPTLSFQSLSPDVLSAIGRSNMELEHFKNLMIKYNSANVPVYSELILGLPEETYDSFADGICTLLDCGQHTCIGIYPCELLPNSLLADPSYMQKYGIKTVRTPFSQYHCKPAADDVSELSNIIVSTSSMGIEDWRRSFIFSICVQAFHNLGLTRALAMYLRHEKNTSYKVFYEKLIDWLDNQPVDSAAGGAYAHLKQLTVDVSEGRGTFSVPYGENEIITWSFEEYIFFRISRELNRFFDELAEFVKVFDIEKKVFDGLMSYQKHIIRQPFESSITIDSEYDFYGYFNRIYSGDYLPLEKKKTTIVSEGTEFRSWDEYARICIWYGRRDDAQLNTGKKNRVMR
ncbi:MAG: radical SAM protein [Ruminococcaceae bacterium]|nr:radical SAM protein [Oscillospiraceae bacterium]